MSILLSILDFLSDAFTRFVIFYFASINLVYFLMLLFSFLSIRFYLRRNLLCDYRIIVQSEFTTPVSVLAPAYNESVNISESVHSLLKLNYSTMEVIVINDGSKDDTLNILIQHFHLRKTRRLYVAHLPTQPVRGIYTSQKAEYKNLVVVDKVNGGKADALNVGINVSRYPLFCAIDADSILEDDALLKATKPFMEDDTTIAVGGIVRIANGCTVQRGRVTDVALSGKFLPVFQVVEYFRAFLTGRMAWSAANALLIISGAFGIFKKNVVLEVGGYKHDTVGEDMELVIRLHRLMRETKRPYRIIFVPDPVCWTEAPETLSMLRRQRNRWHRGLLDTLLIHRTILFNPKYGMVGLFAAPYFLFYELLGPVIEGMGYIVVIAMLLLGTLNTDILLLFFIVSVVYGMMFSVGAVILEEISFHRYPRTMDLVRLIGHAFIENFGYRQLTAFWRIQAIIDYARGVKHWGPMQRKGFASHGQH
ncbi:MAG: glycosyltransferase [Ignavibacteriales bacterium]|nr:glycosyltransferase [Ignavibacteriales bacterium]